MNKNLEKNIEDGINLFFDIIKELFKNLTPNLDLNDIRDKSIYIERMAKWGWTYCYDLINVYGKNDFNNQEEIDNYLFQKFTEDGGDVIFDSLVDIIKSYPKIEIELYEAKQCYNNKEFRASAMIVTSLIEKLLILDQKEFLVDHERIRTGLGAKNVIFEKIKKYNAIETGEETYLALISISKFLEVFFERTNNFENDKKIINRNMLMHGMWANDIIQMDCMKLFLALVNVVTIDMYLSIRC